MIAELLEYKDSTFTCNVLNHYSILENIITTNQLKHQNIHPKLNMLIKSLNSYSVTRSVSPL